jgi:hypothetical protein
LSIEDALDSNRMTAYATPVQEIIGKRNNWEKK